MSSENEMFHHYIMHKKCLYARYSHFVVININIASYRSRKKKKHFHACSFNRILNEICEFSLAAAVCSLCWSFFSIFFLFFFQKRVEHTHPTTTLCTTANNFPFIAQSNAFLLLLLLQ